MASHFSRVEVERFPARLEQPTLAFLHDYWQSKRAGRQMPSRKDIAPFEMKDHLGWVIMIDVLPGMTDFRYRLIGTLVTQYFGWDATGKTAAEAWGSQGRETVTEVYKLLRAIATNKLTVRLHGGTNWSDIGLERFDSLYLPLSDDGETVNVIMHAFVFDKPEVMMARQIHRDTGTKPLDPARRPAVSA